MIRVLKGGLLTTVQDQGRAGYQQYGVAVGGALDAFAARVANVIVGNDEGAALLEMTQTGPDLRFEQDALVAWTGGDYDAQVGGQPLPRERAVLVAAGQTVTFGVARAGLRAWLAVAGGIDVPVMLGSRSTYRRAGFGGLQGRGLAAGDELKTFAPSDWAARQRAGLASTNRLATAWTVRPDTMGQPAAAGLVRAMRGPEWDWFADESQRDFFAASWEGTREADRMGERLAGPVLRQSLQREMISAAVNAGVVQVPPAGQPIVLLRSRQSVGGYPRLAVVAGVDLGRLTQLRPGEKLRFERISVQQAHDLWLRRERDFTRAKLGLARLGG